MFYRETCASTSQPVHFICCSSFLIDFVALFNRMNSMYKFCSAFEILIFLIIINSLSATAAHKRARECVLLLQSWKRSYMETRAFIEESGVGSRWEFDKKILFGRVDHVTRISQDVSDIAKVTLCSLMLPSHVHFYVAWHLLSLQRNIHLFETIIYTSVGLRCTL